MKWRLKRTDINPPGSFPYEQIEGIRKKFPAESSIEAQAYAVLDFRKGNNLPRATLQDAAEDVDEYTCVRLGNMKEWCRDLEGKPYVSPVVKSNGSCGSCGASL